MTKSSTPVTEHTPTPSHDALVKALEDIRFIAEDPIGLTEREHIQKICNATLASIKDQP